MKVYDLFWIIFLWCGLFLKPLLNLLQFCFWIFVLIFYLWGIWDFSSLPGTESIPLTLEIQILTTRSPGKSCELIFKYDGKYGWGGFFCLLSFALECPVFLFSIC